MSTQRRLFLNKAQGSVVATWVVCVLSIAAAALLAGYLRQPPG